MRLGSPYGLGSRAIAATTACGLWLVNVWLERLARVFLVLLAVVGVGFVARDILSSHSVGLAVIYLLCYLALLYPLFLGLQVGLAPKIRM